MAEPVSTGMVVAALLAKALNRAEDSVIDGAVQVARKSIEALRQRFLREGDTDAEETLARMSETPDSPRQVKALADLFDDRLGRSPHLLDELIVITEQLKGTGIAIESVDQMAQGNNIVQAAGNFDSEIHVDQRIVPRSHE